MFLRLSEIRESVVHLSIMENVIDIIYICKCRVNPGIGPYMNTYVYGEVSNMDLPCYTLVEIQLTAA